MGDFKMITVTAFRIAFNGFRRVIEENIQVKNEDALEELRAYLKDKYQCEYVDMFYRQY